jgi:hypothetical protein
MGHFNEPEYGAFFNDFLIQLGHEPLLTGASAIGLTFFPGNLLRIATRSTRDRFLKSNRPEAEFPDTCAMA